VFFAYRKPIRHWHITRWAFGFGLVAGVLVCFGATATAFGSQPPITIVAVASDAQSVIVRDEQGKLHRYRAGDALAASDWTVTRVAGAYAFFRSTRLFRGKPLEWRAHVGDRLDLAATARTPAAILAPHAVSVMAQPRHPAARH
jgi:hypothetical protein